MNPSNTHGINELLLIFAVCEFFVASGIILYLIPKAKQIEELSKAVTALTRELADFKVSMHKEYVSEPTFKERTQNICWDVVKLHCKECPNHKKLEDTEHTMQAFKIYGPSERN